MGLGLNLLAAVPRGGLRRQPGREAIFESITKTVNEFARRQPAPLSDWTWAATQGDVLHVSLFPVEEDIEFSVDSQRVTCSAKTSTAGPGYHAHVIAARQLDHRAPWLLLLGARG
jgi:hypothetical protein